MKYIVKTRELVWEPKYFPGEKTQYGDFKALWREHGTNQFEIRITRIPPGGTNTKYHTHSKEEEWFYVISGSCHICIDDIWDKIEEGDSIFKPIGVFHIFRNFGNEPCEILMMGTNIEGSTVARLPEPAPPKLT